MKHTPHNLATCTLTTLALATLLLTGCTQEKTNSAPSPEVSQSGSASSSTAPITDEGNSPTPIPSPSESTSYSGGSKAPAGEYRPADDLGPAQNVPRPVEPEGMKIESEEGLQKFLFYWNDTMNYGIQTGDFTAARPLVHESFTLDVEFIDFATALYDDGGWISGGLRQVVLGEGLMVNQGDGYYTWAGNANIENIHLHHQGEKNSYDNSDIIGVPVYYEARHVEGQWKILAVRSLNFSE